MHLVESFKVYLASGRLIFFRGDFMFPDFSLEEALIYNATAHDPYSKESVARRMIASGVSERAVSILLGMDLEQIEKLSCSDAIMLMKLLDGFNDVFHRYEATEGILPQAYRNVEKVKEWYTEHGIEESNLFRDSVDIDTGFARVFGLTPSQHKDFIERYVDKK